MLSSSKYMYKRKHYLPVISNLRTNRKRFLYTVVEKCELCPVIDKTQYFTYSLCVVEGMTGIPFVDANMREMLATGWMSNRGRQNIASFLARDLQLDWRMGAELLESYLVSKPF